MFHVDGGAEASSDLVERMAGRLRHRGPDAAGVHVRGPVGLAVRRLAIVDPAGGAQPMVNDDASVAVAFNGEIYNFRELRAVLRTHGHRFATDCDTEVVLRAYEHYGPECVQHFRGMFAFAIWDAPRRHLFLARDRFGIKPLYYAWDGRTFHFGSEIKALLAAGVRRAIDATALDDFFTFTYIPAPRTIFTAVRKLSPGRTLSVSANGVVEREYWDLVFEPREIDAATCATRLGEALRATVALHLDGAATGMFLSGGIDSSALTAVAAELAAGPVDTFSIGFAESAFDERPFARAVAQRWQTRAHESLVRHEAVQVVDRLAEHFDEPFADSSMVPTYHLCQLARAHLRVCCAGDGGDEVFAGYPRFAAFQERAAVDPAGAEDAYLAARTWLSPEMKARLYGNWLRRELRGYDPLAQVRAHFAHARQWDPLSRIQYVESKTYLPGDLLTKVDRASMAHGLEVRVPLLDHRLVEHAARIPSALKLRDGVSKAVLKQALGDRLPAQVVERPKRGFSMPLAAWMRGPLRPWVEQRLFHRQTRLGEWVDLAVVREWWQDHQRGRNLNRFLWSLIVLDAWAARYGDAAGDPERPS
ncbi:asparagine synthase (glutamine-hydrolyzing) [bacterium]|nr:asparagine synthase (glutamine-hydrolyzing) [bacterium]